MNDDTIPFSVNKPLAPIPTFLPLASSPQLVRILDRIRSGPLEESDEHAEFCWFIREYPRIYRHHFGHAEYRLAAIRRAYEYHRTQAEAELARIKNADSFIESHHMASGRTPYSTFAIYWDFESLLQAVSSALDIATRIVGTAYKGDTPPNFNRFCKTAPQSNLKEVFVAAKTRWVNKMKAYRDCFTHYTPVDTILSVNLVHYADVFELRAKLPINPESREILRFRFNGSQEVSHFRSQN